MFLIKLTARPDARMVEVPLDIEVELPREFDGAAVLASSGMPRKVRLRTPKDAVKLSTAYRIDQLVADLVRLVLRGAPQDVMRAQEGAAVYLKMVRERRQEGAVFLLESDGRGHVQLVEQAVHPAANAFRSSTGSAALSAAALAERLATVERSLAALEARMNAVAAPEAGERPRGAGEHLERRLEQRFADLEEQLSAAQRGEPLGRAVRTSQALPTPGASRAGMRRATAVEAFAEGLRTELKSRARTLLQSAQERAALCDKAAQIADDAERSGGPKLEASATLARLAAEAGARASALLRMSEEIELYAAADVPLASQLLDRLARGDAQDPVPLLRDVTEEGWISGTLQLGWLSRAAQLAGWKVIAPQPGDLFEPSMHEQEGPKGEVIEALLKPGVHDRSGAMLLHAKVRLRGRADDELRALESELDGAAPLLEAGPPAPRLAGAEEESDGAPLTAERAPGEEELESAPIVYELPSAPILEELTSAPILEELTSAPILEELFPAPSRSGPIISAPIVSAEIVSDPIISAEIVSGQIISGPVPEEPQAADSVQGIAPAQASAPDAAAAAPEPDRSTGAPPPAPADADWERIGQGPSAFSSSEGKPGPEAAPPAPASEPHQD